MKKKLISLTIFFSTISLFLIYDFYFSYKRLTYLANLKTTNISPIQPVLIADPLTGWNNVKNVTKTHNSEGNFSATYALDENGFKTVFGNSDKSQKNIYFFGDSFTFGYGISNKDDFPNKIRTRLTAQVNVYNAAVIGFGITQIYTQLLKHLDKIKPGDVVVFAPIIDDLERNLHDFKLTHAYVYKTLLNVNTFPELLNDQIIQAETNSSTLDFLESLLRHAKYSRVFWKLLYDNVYLKQNITAATKIIALAKQKIQNKGAHFVLFFIPKFEDCAEHNYDLNLVDFDYVDLLDYCPKDMDTLNKMVFPQDLHLTELGHRLLAEHILKKLIQKKYIMPDYVRSNSDNGVSF